MDDALVDALMQEFEKGNKVNGTFTSTMYNNVTVELVRLFGDKIDKVKIQNRWKTLEINYNEYNEIFKGGMSGFSWNSTKQIWDAESDVWDALIESKPKAVHWRLVSFPNYEKMLILHGPNRVDGYEYGTFKEIRKRGALITKEDFVEAIQEDIDDRVARNEVTLESFYASDYDFTSPERQSYDLSTMASGGKRKKLKMVKTKETNNVIIELKESMKMVVEALGEGNAAIREGNEIMREHHKHELPPISGEETWNLVKECGCDMNSLPQIYCVVMKNIDKLRMILQCPPEARKAVIMQMVFGSSD